MVWLKAHWLWLVGGLVAFVAYRHLSAPAAPAQNASDSTAQSQQLPIIYPSTSAAGYGSAAGVSAGVSDGGSSGVTDSMLSYLTTVSQQSGALGSQALTNAASATQQSTDTAKQTTSMNSAVSSTLADSFSALLSSWTSNPANYEQTLNVTANPTSAGGVSFSTSKDFNAAALPTMTQAGNFAAGAFNTLFAPPVPTVVDHSFANFDSVAYLNQHPDIANALNTTRAFDNRGNMAQRAFAWYNERNNGTAFTPINTVNNNTHG